MAVMSTARRSSATIPSPKPPVFTSSASVGFSPAFSSTRSASAWLVETGGFGEGIVALDLGAVDITPIPEPLWSQHQAKYRAVVKASDLLPPLDNVVGVTTGKAAAARGDFILAVIRARRQVVDFMYANPDESADIIAKVYNLSSEVARRAEKNLLTSHEKSGVRYWSAGE